MVAFLAPVKMEIGYAFSSSNTQILAFQGSKVVCRQKHIKAVECGGGSFLPFSDFSNALVECLTK